MIDGEDGFATFEEQARTDPADAENLEANEEADAEAGEQEEAEEEEAARPKPRQTAQERIDEITAARREAERDAKYWRDVAMGKAKPNGASPSDEAKAPSPEDFDMGETDPKYIEAVIEYRVEKGLDKVRSSVAQDLHVQAQGRAWEASQQAARSEFADYDDLVIDGAHKWPCTPDMAEAIRTSDVGGKLAYHLASNPEEARRIAAIENPFAQVRELGRLEAALENPKAAKTTNAPKPPVGQARGAGGQFSPSASTTNFAEFEALAKRKA